MSNEHLTCLLIQRREQADEATRLAASKVWCAAFDGTPFGMRNSTCANLCELAFWELLHVFERRQACAR